MQGVCYSGPDIKWLCSCSIVKNCLGVPAVHIAAVRQIVQVELDPVDLSRVSPQAFRPVFVGHRDRGEAADTEYMTVLGKDLMRVDLHLAVRFPVDTSAAKAAVWRF